MKEKVLEILTEIQPDFDFSQDINFIEEGMLDSFDIVNLVTRLDEELKISIDGMDIIPENFNSIDSIIAVLRKNGAE